MSYQSESKINASHRKAMVADWFVQGDNRARSCKKDTTSTSQCPYGHQASKVHSWYCYVLCLTYIKLFSLNFMLSGRVLHFANGRVPIGFIIH